MNLKHLILALGITGLAVTARAESETLVSVNFYAHLNGGLDTPKIGLAAIGHGTNDFWNCSCTLLSHLCSIVCLGRWPVPIVPVLLERRFA